MQKVEQHIGYDMFLIRNRCRGVFLDFLSDKYESPIALTGKVFFSFKKKEKKKGKEKEEKLQENSNPHTF